MGQKVLIIDEDKKLAVELGAILTDNGYEVLISNDSKTGLEKIQTESPDLIVVDVVSQNLTDSEVAETLEKNNVKRAPVILVSLTSGVKVYFSERFPHYFVRKPYDLIEMYSRISRILRERIALDEGAAPVKFKNPFAFTHRAIIFSMDQRLMTCLEQMFAGHGWYVHWGKSEADVLRQVAKLEAHLVVAQYSEDRHILDAQFVYAGLINKTTKRLSVPMLVFCHRALADEAVRRLPRSRVFIYDSIGKLIEEVSGFVTANFPK